MGRFEMEVRIERPPEAVFDWIIRPERMLQTNPPKMKVTLLEAPEAVSLGSRVLARMEWSGPTQELLHEIIEFHPRQGFIEKQIRGPFGAFVHEHRLTADDSATILTDVVDYEPPPGLAGLIVTDSVIRNLLESSFSYRHQALKQLLESQ